MPLENALQLLPFKSVAELDIRDHNLLAFHNLTLKGTIVPVGLKSLLGLGLKFCRNPRPVCTV